MKPIILGYGGRKIPIYYESYNSVQRKKGKKGIKVIGDSNGEEKDFKEIEGLAQIYLIHHAIKQVPKGSYLREIDKVMQTVVGHSINGNLEIEIILEGIAVFN